MKKAERIGVIFLAGLLAMPVNTWLASRVYAQSGSEKLSEKQYQELQQKRQEQWDDLERQQQRQENIGQRRQEGEKRQRDAEKRQREAERLLQEQEGKK
jgi:septal ring factor EnvC (AmiA/AmiB activator)